MSKVGFFKISQDLAGLTLAGRELKLKWVQRYQQVWLLFDHCYLWEFVEINILALFCVTVIALQSDIRLKQTTCKFADIEDKIWKINLIWMFFVKYFQLTCVHICISPNTNYIFPIGKCLTSSWSCLRSTTGYLMMLLCFWVVQMK